MRIGFDEAKGTDAISIINAVGMNEIGVLHKKWTIEKYNGDGVLYETEVIDGNLLLNEGIAELWNLLIGTPGATPFNEANSYIGVGDGTTPASASQTGLVGTNKTYVKVDATFPQILSNTITFRATFGAAVGNHGWREFTVANGSSDAAKNLNRKVESALREKTSPDQWIVSLTITLS